MSSTSPKYGLAVSAIAAMTSSRRVRDGFGVTGHLVEQPAAPRGGVVDLVDVRAELAAAGRHAALAFPALIQWSVPVVSTSICLTDGEVVASRVAIAAVPTRMPSTGIAGKP